MSVSKVHELLQNKGCVWTVSILMVLSVVFGSFFQCKRAEEMGNRLSPEFATPVAVVDGTEITQRLIAQQEKQASAMSGDMSTLPPEQQVQMEFSILNSTVGSVVQLNLAKEMGIEPSDNEIEKFIRDNVESDIEQLKQRLIMQQRIKPDAKPEEFAAEFKKITGKDLEGYREEAINLNLDTIRNAKDLRMPIASMTVATRLMDAYKAKVTLTDDELKKSYDKFDFKRITLMKGDVETKAKKIAQEIKSGAITFEKAIDRYSEEMVPTGTKQKLSEKTEPFSRTTLEGVEFYRPLLKLKEGEVSEPVTIGSTVSLFKLIKIRPDVPKDFDKRKDEEREKQLTTIAAGKFQSELQKRQKAVKIDWKDEVLKQIYEYGRTITESMPVAERKKVMRQVMEESINQATGGDSTNIRFASIMALVAYQDLLKDSTPAEKQALEGEKEKVYAAYLGQAEDVSMRLELVEIYKKKKDGAEFLNQLQQAANNNLGQTNAVGQNIFNQINRLMMEGKNAKLLTDKNVKDLQAIQDQWKQQKADDDKMQAEMKKEEEKATKELLEKQKAETKKALNDVKTREEHKKGAKPDTKPSGTK